MQDALIEKKKEKYRDMAQMAIMFRKAINKKGMLSVNDLICFETNGDGNEGKQTQLQNMLKEWRAIKEETTKWFDEMTIKQEKGELREIKG